MKKILFIIILISNFLNSSENTPLIKANLWPCWYDLAFCCTQCKRSPTKITDIVKFALLIIDDDNDEDDGINFSEGDQDNIIRYIRKFINNGGDINETFIHEGRNVGLLYFFEQLKCQKVVNFLQQ